MTAANQDLLMLLQAELTNYSKKQMQQVLDLLLDGNTVPFIARYRKEATGNLDEVQIREIEERYQYLENLEKRKSEVLRLIEEQEKLTPELAASIKAASKMQQVEDLYRPYKQKRRTKATIAKEQGLEPLAKWLLRFADEAVATKATEFITTEVPDVTTALAGAHEILAEFFLIQLSLELGLDRKHLIKEFIPAQERKQKKMKKAYMKCIMPLKSPLKRWFLTGF